jgi:hypothetical protein
MRITVTCLVLFAALLVLPLAATPASVPLTTVVSLNPGANEFTEGLAIDNRAVVVAVPGTARPGYHGLNGSIAFASERDGEFEI